MNIFVIADPPTYLAFALAGIQGRPVDSATEVLPLLESLNREQIGLVLITETLADQNREAIGRLLLEPGGPLILEIPGLEGPLPKRHSLTERLASLLRR